MSPGDERSQDQSLSAFAAICLFLLASALMLGLPFVFSAAYAALHDTSLTEGIRHVRGQLVTLTLGQVLALTTAILVGLKLQDAEGPLGEHLHLAPLRSRTLLACLSAGLFLQFPLAELANVLHHHVLGPESLEEQLARQSMLEAHSPFQGALVVLCIVALVPASEELLFRGLFMFGLCRRYGRGFGLLISSLLFGLIHFSAVPVVYASVAGLVLGTVALATGSVWSSIALHAAINAVPVLLPESLLAIRGFNVPSAQPEHLSAWLVWPPLLAGVLLLLGVRLTARSPHE